MRRIIIFSGTTEGRELAQSLAKEEIDCLVSVATQYGQELMEEDEHISVRTGRLTSEEMTSLWEEEKFLAVVDATHPFAIEVTENIKKSLEGTGIPYFRLGRQISTPSDIDAQCFFFDSSEECAACLENTTGRILLTTGSKELGSFCKKDSLKERLVVRVLPAAESLEICRQNGLDGKQIIAMQGPFTEEMNLETIKQYQIQGLVTKESGKTGGEDTKLLAAGKAGIPCYIIRKPHTDEEEAESTETLLPKLFELAGKEKGEPILDITLAGIGMGSIPGMTLQVKEQIDRSDYLFGAERLIRELHARKEKHPFYLEKDVMPFLTKLLEEKKSYRVTILFSGDTGFFSGCSKLGKAISTLEHTRVRVLPGISTVAALGAAVKVSWQDAMIVSAHGTAPERWESEILFGIRRARKIFFLTSGPVNVQRIGELLTQAGCAAAYRILVGYQLSYPEEWVRELSVQDCAQIQDPGLYAGFLVPGENAESCPITPGWHDEAFLRGKVPMTKEEVRAISICKLGLTEQSVVLDVGSGTGSMAMEMAALSPKIKVYAIENDPEALSLIKQNKEMFGMYQIDVIDATAPEGLDQISEKVTHAFIGGTKGHMKEILETLYCMNPHMRVVINAVTLETISRAGELLKNYEIEDEQIVSVSVNPVKKVGQYHMLQANNPVMIFAFTFRDKEQS